MASPKEVKIFFVPKLPSEEELKAEFDKLPLKQKSKAVKFARLSDHHICLLRDVIRREKAFRTKAKAVVERRCLGDIMLCSSYAGIEPLGGDNLSQAEYEKWKSNQPGGT